MSLFKRVIINIIRQPGKNGLLFALIFILGIALSGAISVRHAIYNTEESLMMRLPTISMLDLNEAAAARDAGIPMHEVNWHQDRPTIEDISAVGNLSYVRRYNAMIEPWVWSSQNLMWAYADIDYERVPPGTSLMELESIIGGLSSLPDVYVELFPIKGISSPDIIKVDSGRFTLVEGRTFTQEEIDNGDMMVVVSRGFAEVNQLTIGGIIELENTVHNIPKMTAEGVSLEYYHEERFFLAYQVLEFEIIGIFDICLDFIYETLLSPQGWGFGNTLFSLSRLYNYIYMPIQIAEDIANFQREGFREIQDEIDLLFPGQGRPAENTPITAFFVLHDPRDLESFSEIATELLPGFWEVADFGEANHSIISAMDTLTQIANIIQWAAVIAAIIVLTLIIILFLRDRRHEIGIYMALGDKKRNVITQILAEVGLIAALAIILSLFVGNALSNSISRSMFEQSLIYQMEKADEIRIPFHHFDVMLLFNPGEITVEETMAVYDVSLDANTVVLFLLIGSGVVLSSALISVLYIVKMEPKEILM